MTNLTREEANEIRHARSDTEKALQDELDALRNRLLDVPEYHDLAARLRALKHHTPLACGCHCSGWCNGYNPCMWPCQYHGCP